MSNSNQQLQSLFQSVLNANSFPSHIKVEASLHKKTGQLVLSGEVPVEWGSLLNLCTYDFIKQRGSTTEWVLDYERVHRGPLKFVKVATPSDAPSSVKVARPLSVPDEELTEFSETEQSLHRKVAFVAEWVEKFRGSPFRPRDAPAPASADDGKLKADNQEFVIYTGAGISTAAKIPDFRGPQGVWTRRDRGLAPPKSVAMEQAIPTLAHRAVKRLLDDNVATYLVSQNVDGLHRRSGIPAHLISELHGNCYIETCASCNAEYLRTFDVCNHHGPYFANVQDKLSQSGISHITGRKCACGGMLRDSIIHFRENLPIEALERGMEHSKRAKLGLVLGSSLHVTPAADLPVIVSEHNSGVLCVVNLQATGRDVEALWSGGILIHSKIDQFADLLMKYLGYQPGAYAEESKEQQLAAAVAGLGLEQEPEPEPPKAGRRSGFFNKLGLPSSMVQLPPSLIVSQTIHPSPGVWSLDLQLPQGYPSALADIVHSVTYCGVAAASPSAPVTPQFKASEAPFHVDSFCFPKTAAAYDAVRCDVEFSPDLDAPSLPMVHALVFDASRRVAATEVRVPPLQMNPGFLASIKDRAASALRHVTTRVTARDGSVSFEEAQRSGGVQ